MKSLLFIVLWLPYLVKSQDTGNLGIQWITNLTWQEIKEKAKHENKYIFVDCYATWCKPCRLMDRDIYPNDTVGNYINANFISLRLQMDATTQDIPEIQKWYATAKTFQIDYSVSVFPTFLFFSPNGNLVHKDVGAKNVQQMLMIAAQAMDTSQQYYALLEKYKQNNISIVKMSELAQTAKKLGDKELSLRIAAEYTKNYLNKLPIDSLFNKNILTFVGDFPENIHSTDKIIQLCLEQSPIIDKVMFPGFAKNVVEYFIRRDFVIPALKNADKNKVNPNWNNLTNNVKKAFNEEYALSTVLNAKPDYYKFKKDWKNYTKSVIQKVEKDLRSTFKGVEGALDLNNNAWDIFLYSNDKNQLNKALVWSDYALNLAASDSFILAGCMDTKANILYKLGNKHDARIIEEAAIRLSPKQQAIGINLEKMKKEKPTWD